MTSLYPLSTKEELVKQFVGKSLKDVPTPAAILDISKIKTNCNRMLETVDELKFGWRAHIKTHKTTELTRLQVGEGTGAVNIIVSTVAEAENVVPLLLEYKAAGREINVLYAFPPTLSSLPRLSAISKVLGPSAVSLMIDHPSQLNLLSQISFPHPPLIFLKIDMGSQRAGVVPNSPICIELIKSLLTLNSQKFLIFYGLYSHAGQSYYSTTQTAAIDYLRQELESLLATSTTIHSHPLVLSVGATPTTISIRSLKKELLINQMPKDVKSALNQVMEVIQKMEKQKCKIELHAGVYPILDIQQLATHALPESMLKWDNLALTILAEVASIYPGRGKNGSTEALIASGSLALGREPCKAYPGWGVLTPWNRPDVSVPQNGPEEINGWIVGRISQEHGILTWAGGIEDELEVGQRIRIWPNHACIAGAGYDWYLIVDGGDEIVDVWVRWRGW